MSDLIKDANYLRYYFTNEAMSMDKDVCKDQAFLDYKRKCTGLMALPIGLTLWQMTIVNDVAHAGTYYKLRALKTIALGGAMALCLWEYTNLQKKLTYYNRFYPEATELQKQLTREAQIFSENTIRNQSVEERLDVTKDPNAQTLYRQFYQLKPARHSQPDHEFQQNSADHASRPSKI